MKNYRGYNWELVEDVAETEDGYVIAGTSDTGSIGSLDAWLLKIDKEGNELWNKKFGNRLEDVAYSIVIDNAYIVAGSTNENYNRQGMLIKCYDDAYEPSIEIVRPKKNYLYIFDGEIMPYEETFVIGKITIIVEANDEEKRILEVGFYLSKDYEPRYVDHSPPYEWKWNEFIINIRTPCLLIAGAYYSKSKAVVSDKIYFKIINL